MVPESDYFQLVRVATQDLVPRSHTGSSLSTLCKSARSDTQSFEVSLSVTDIRAAAKDSLRSLRAPCNPSTPRGIRGCRRNDAMPGTPIALRAKRCEDSAGEDGHEIWLERSGTHEAKPQLHSFPVGHIIASPDQRRVEDLIAVCSSLVNTNVDISAQDRWSLGTGAQVVESGPQARVHRHGPSISCSSVNVPRSLQSPTLQSETPGLTPASSSVSRESFLSLNWTLASPPADTGMRSSGGDASPSLQGAMDIRQSFWNVLGMMRQGTCCSAMSEQCVAGQCGPGHCETRLSVSGKCVHEQCDAFVARPAVCDKDRRRSVGEFIVGRSDSEPAPAVEEEGFIPECWAGAEECSKKDGGPRQWKDWQWDLHAEAYGDDEVVVNAGRSPSLHSASGLQKQLRRGGA